jgi:3-oxoacyl-(acyl-carrier-protein) synthase
VSLARGRCRLRAAAGEAPRIPPMPPHRVFVRGAGARTPLGRTWAESAAALAAGASAVAPIAGFDATGFPCTVAAAAPGGAGDRRLALALPAVREAWDAAGAAALPERIGVFVGAESGRVAFSTLLAIARAAGGGETFDHASFGRGAAALAGLLSPARLSPASVTSAVAGMIGARGPVATISLACASGAAAIAEAARAVRLGACDVALAGGVGADVDVLMLAAFGLLGALSARGVSCPFDARRDGFVLGEGAAMVVLARERGGAVAEIAGSGSSLDAHHLTAPEPTGDGAARAMRAAIRAGGGGPVDYVQAHGTSTMQNDAVEAAAIRRVLGADLDHARVSSVKGALGHAIAGAGAIGFLCALDAVERGTVLPTAGLRDPDRGCELPHVTGSAERREVRAALCNAFAFGGANVSLLVRRAA